MKNFEIPENKRSCPYFDEGCCTIMKREARIVNHIIPIKCNGWCITSLSEKHFQQMARNISGRKI